MSYDPQALAIQGANQNFTSTTPADITGLVLPVVAGVHYEIMARLVFSSDSLTAGLKLSYTCPAGTILTQVGIPETGDAVGMYHWGNLRSSGGTITAVSVGATGTNYLATIDGFFAPTASGNFQIQAASSTTVGSPTITVKASSHLRLTSVA